MSMELKNFCVYDKRINRYVISDDYNVSVYRRNNLLSRERNPENNENSECVQNKDHIRIDFAYIGSEKTEYQIEALSSYLSKFSNNPDRRGLHFKKDFILRLCDNPVFNKIQKISPAYQHVALGWFLPGEDILFRLNTLIEFRLNSFFRDEGIYFDYLNQNMTFNNPECAFLCYKDVFKALPYLKYEDDPYDHPIFDDIIDIEIETKNNSIYISEYLCDLYPILCKLFMESVIDNPKSYKDTYMYRIEQEIESEMEAYRYEENIRDSINEFNSMMDEEGGWENID